MHRSKTAAPCVLYRWFAFLGAFHIALFILFPRTGEANTLPHAPTFNSPYTRGRATDTHAQCPVHRSSPASRARTQRTTEIAARRARHRYEAFFALVDLSFIGEKVEFKVEF